ncbi:hypothetical protein D0869_03554 [Hortaea werneckii]|uniref:Uncharacterized protein n=1 Tax=Hortaea werneckii TaxID=91943 RepID=A0A3M6X4Q1_HORWE|nr:hypothetical protein KC324_g753 [Hortaea werneckii]KAI7595220.1 hypothetical protein KC316_g665 [Hortaea werneckii]RMX85795.1 hypothetical protein D0869_03554 [Hortaea werneckii]
MGKRRPKPPIEQGAPVSVEIATDASSYTLPLHRSENSLFEFMDVLELNDSVEAGSEIQTGKWMGWQFEEDGKEVNNMGLPIAILHYESGHCEVAVLRGVKVAEEEPSQGRLQTRVVCSPECWIIEVENIGSAVTEEEIKEGGKGYGRVATTYSNGARFSLDRYHLLTPIKPRCSKTTQMIEGRITCAEHRLELAPEPPAPPSLLSEPGQPRWIAAQERWVDTPEPDNGRGVDPDAQPDTEPDAELTAEPNAAEPDEEPGAEPDAEPDTEPDTEPDMEARAESDAAEQGAGLDAGPDAEPNVAPDAEQDIGPGSESDAPLTAAEPGKTEVQKMSKFQHQR